MIIRYKNSKNEIKDEFVFENDVDYWADTVKMQVIMEFNGKKHVVFRSKVYDRLSKAIDIIYQCLKENPDGFIDTTSLK